MPTYEYIREDGTTFELFQSINDNALTTCPDTGQKVKRVISGGGGVVYKGDGFYITDYKNNGKSDSGNTKSGDKTEAKKDASEKPASGKESTA